MQIRRLAAAVLVPLGILGPPSDAVAEAARPWVDTALSPDERARLIVAEMTLEEKVALLHSSGKRVIGDQEWQVYVKGVERLGIPDLTMADGATGLRGGTQFPIPLGLAASFSREDATQFGDILGRETRQLGYGVILGPTVNLARSPLHGRTFEAFGEDPFLTGEIAVPQTKAIQANRVLADGKHFAVNNIERWRTLVDAKVDERVYHELYLPHFKELARDADAATMMCAFNKINGVFACDNEELLEELLRDRWGYKGFVRTDANAYHSVDSVAHGLEQELPKSLVFDDDLIAAVGDGRVDIASVDRAVHRILRTMIAFGVFDDPPARTGVPAADHLPAARTLAENAIVLLKNDGDALPLSEDVGSIAVIGADANSPVTYGGGSVNIAPAIKDTIVDGIKARVPGADVRWSPGTDPIGPASNAPGFDPTPSAVLTSTTGVRGLTATYFRRPDFTRPIETRVDASAYTDFAWYGQHVGSAAPKAPGGSRSARWRGSITAPVAGEYAFDLSSFETSRLRMGGTLLIDNTGSNDATPKTASVVLAAGETRPLTVEWQMTDDNEFKDEARWIKFGWRPPAGMVDPAVAAAAETARQARRAIVVVRDFVGEGQDRPTLRLPHNQDQLIEEVVRANPNTTVVLTTGTAVSMPWLDKVPAVVEAWYGGSAHGAALARVLFGDVNPSGRLPITFPRTDSDLPTGSPQQFPGVDKVAHYSEGLRVGYRHYLAAGTLPLFPFGHGLSYSRFSYDEFRLSRPSMAALPAHRHGGLDGLRGVTATFRVTNTGAHAGAVVPQLYVESPESAGVPSRQLKGFEKVFLAPGESREVAIGLDQQAFAVYEPAADQFEVRSGMYRVHLAESAGSVLASADYEVSATAGAPRIELAPPALVTPGEVVTIDAMVANDGTAAAANLVGQARLPAGWQAVSKPVPPVVGPGGRVGVRWQVRVPENAKPGAYRIGAELAFTAIGRRATSLTRETVHIGHDSIADAFTNKGITDDSAVAAGDLDGSGHTLSAQALASVGYTPGARVTAGGVAFTWPDRAPGQADNVAAYGQAIRLDGQGDTVALLGTGTSKPTAGPLTVLYADGTRTESQVGLGDWWADKPGPGATAAVSMPYLNTSTAKCANAPVVGTTCDRRIGLYVTKVPVDPAKRIVGIVLPRVASTPAGPMPAMHVFAAAVG